MSRSPYAKVFARPEAVAILLLGVLVRTPLAAIGPLLTVHVVRGLGLGYSEAGVVVMVNTIAAAISGPWRGHLIDRQGLRPTLLTSMIATGLCWSIAPFVGYWWLVLLGGAAGALAAPVWSMIRQAVLAAVPADERRTALSLDSITTEIAFMVGPLLSLWLGTTYPTRYVLFGFQMLGIGTLLVLWLRNPAMVSGDGHSGVRVPRRVWLGPRFIAVCIVAFACHVVLIGGDVGITAALLGWKEETWLGLVYVFWCAGSIVGALVYGALHRHVSPFFMLGALAVLSLPMAFAQTWTSMAALCFLAGLFCAPSLTSTVEAISEIVPERARGEAMGWHGSFLTVGAAAGAPLVGWFIDESGFSAGIIAAAVFGLVMAVAGALTVRVVGARRTARPVPAESGDPADGTAGELVAPVMPTSPITPGSESLLD